jgi:hypothetical protein
MYKKIAMALAVVTLAGGLAACSSDADVASKNLSKAADQFEIARRIVFYNSITDTYILEVDGFCSLGNDDPVRYVSITCKDGDGFKKHFFFRSDNTTVFAEQLDSAQVDTEHYRVIFKPSTIIPDVDAR